MQQGRVKYLTEPIPDHIASIAMDHANGRAAVELAASLQAATHSPPTAFTDVDRV